MVKRGDFDYPPYWTKVQWIALPALDRKSLSLTESWNDGGWRGLSLNSLKRRRHAILLAALVWVALIESFSHRQVLGPVLSDLVITATLLLVFLIVFDRWVNRLVAFIALAIAVVAGWAHLSAAELR